MVILLSSPHAFSQLEDTADFLGLLLLKWALSDYPEGVYDLEDYTVGKTFNTLDSTQIAENELYQMLERNSHLRNEVIKTYLEQNGRLITHIVDRGETLEYLAPLYGTSIKDIQTLNDGIEECYMGQELDIPTLKTDYDIALDFVILNNTMYTEAKRAYDSGEYKQAVKCYDKIIRGDNPTIYAYYYRGMSQYYRDKMNQAYYDLSYVVSNDTEGKFPDAVTYRDQAREIQAQRDAERDELWGALFETAVQVGMTYLDAKAQSKQSQYSSSSYSSTDTSYASSDYESASSSSAGSRSSSSCPSLKVANGKWYCANTGQCGMCGGDGWMDGDFGQGPNTLKCTLCGGTGKCKYCNN